MNVPKIWRNAFVQKKKNLVRAPPLESCSPRTPRIRKTSRRWPHLGPTSNVKSEREVPDICVAFGLFQYSTVSGSRRSDFHQAPILIDWSLHRLARLWVFVTPCSSKTSTNICCSWTRSPGCWCSRTRNNWRMKLPRPPLTQSSFTISIIIQCLISYFSYLCFATLISLIIFYMIVKSGKKRRMMWGVHRKGIWFQLTNN
jgi:hypothetical protein